MTLPTVDVIIPTFNNPEYLRAAVTSLLMARVIYPYRLVVVNNGHPDSVPHDWPNVEVVDVGKNLGWEGGLKAGLARSSSEFVVFSNDDIFIPRTSLYWCRQLLTPFKDASVAAVGPASNVVMGAQNVFNSFPFPQYYVPFLIGFFMMVRRSALDAVGGVDDTLPGGDDLDLSIRFRKAGHKLVARYDTFVYHHGFKTGERVHGGPDKPGGWNSHEMTERVDNALIRKHGFRWWYSLYQTTGLSPAADATDVEGATIVPFVPPGMVLELGCGDKRTVPWAVGVDRYGAGERTAHAQTSIADVVADVFQPLPFPDAYADALVARHILEHAIDPVTVLREWRRVLKPGGRLIVACPDQGFGEAIPMDVEHVHAWTPAALQALAEVCGYRAIGHADPGNGVSFVGVYARREDYL